MKAVEVKEPVAKIWHDSNSYTAIYVLRDKTQKFRMPGVKDDSPRAWDYGPSIITERMGPQGCETVTRYPDDATMWKWLGAVLNIGAYVLTNEQLSAQLPKDLKSYWAA